LFFTALGRFRDQQGLGSRMHKFRFKNKLLSLCQRRLNIPQFPPVEKSPLSPVEISPGAERRL
jgi:hypothetical protein